MRGEAQSAVKLDVLVFCTLLPRVRRLLFCCRECTDCYSVAESAQTVILLPRVHRLLFCCRECTDCYSVAESAQTVIFLFRSNTSVIHRLSSTDITS